MRILFLTQIVPYPPDAGPKVKTWNVLRHLKDAGHQVILATFVRPEEEPYLPVLRNLCAEIHPVPIRRSRFADLGHLALSLVQNDSFLIRRDNLRSMRDLVVRLYTSGKIDVIHADQITMTQFALDPACRVPRIFDAHNATWKLVARTLRNFPAPVRWLLGRETQFVRDYESRVLRTFEHTFTVTPVDRDFLLELFPPDERARMAQKITSTPISVDCDTITPVERPGGSLEIVTLGTLHYPPNADGIRWFIQNVFPHVLQRIPHAHLTVLGKNPPDDFLREAQRIPSSLTIAGYVPDLQPYFQRAGLIVVPVRSGGGMRVRILEAFAYGLPVVTTTAGLEGIEAISGEEVLVEDEPLAFANAVVTTLLDAGLQARLSTRGRKLVEEKYHWRKTLRMMDPIYQRLWESSQAADQ